MKGQVGPQGKPHLPQRVRGVCVACGSQNIVSGGDQCHCRSCGLVGPDFSAAKALSGYISEVVSIDSNQAHAMADGVLEALSLEATKAKLQRLLIQGVLSLVVLFVLMRKYLTIWIPAAKGDVGLLCHFYIPRLLDVWGQVAAKHGFSPTIEGVKESLLVLGRHATVEDEDHLSQKLIRIRHLITPTGAWIKEDANAEANDMRKKLAEEEKQRQQREETKRQEEVALENAKLARLRAKKVALGLDPLKLRVPRLELSPPSDIVAHPNAYIQLRVIAHYSTRYQWFCNGKALEEDKLCIGAKRTTLTILRLTRRTIGSYYCVCTNEEGAVASRPSSVQIVTLTSRARCSRRLEPMTGEAVPFSISNDASSPVLSGVAVCANGHLQVLNTKSLTPIRTIPSLTFPTGAVPIAVAWHPKLKLLAVAVRLELSRPSTFELVLFSLDTSTASSESPTEPPVRTSTTKFAGVSSMRGPTEPHSVLFSRRVTTREIPARLRSVEMIRFAHDGRTLLVSDLRSSVLLFDMSEPSILCKRSWSLDQPNHPLCHIASLRNLMSTVSPRAKGSFCGLSMSFRRCSYVELIDIETFACRKLHFKLPVHRSAIDSSGFALAVAESGSLNTWVCVISIADRESGHLTSKKRFVAHQGKVSGMEWTTQSSLLITSGHDGYVKLWDLECCVDGKPACMFCLHLDIRGIRSLVVPDPFDTFVAIGYSGYCVHACGIPQLEAFEEFRVAERDRIASRIQKIVKGRQTRKLIREFITPGI